MRHDLLLNKFELSVNTIQKKVCELANVTLLDLCMPDKMPMARKRDHVIARQVSMKLIKDRFPFSLSKIGNLHGGRDHATVLYACKTIENLIDTKDTDVTWLYIEATNALTIMETQSKIISERLKNKSLNFEIPNEDLTNINEIFREDD